MVLEVGQTFYADCIIKCGSKYFLPCSLSLIFKLSPVDDSPVLQGEFEDWELNLNPCNLTMPRVKRTRHYTITVKPL